MILYFYFTLQSVLQYVAFGFSKEAVGTSLQVAIQEQSYQESVLFVGNLGLYNDEMDVILSQFRKTQKDTEGKTIIIPAVCQSQRIL